ncbi:MAG: hypothetical protein ACE5PO_07165, partial [Candidatus Bathyarchaeia archaeon]
MRILPLELGILMVLVAGSLILGAPATSAQEIVTPAPLRFTVYEDGVVHVDYLVNVDPTKPRAIVTVFGSSFSDLVVTDREGFPLDFTSADGTLTIDSLGADAVRITYVTHELTGKNGLVWTFAAVTPVDSSVLLPPTATVLSLSEMPKIIRSVDGQTQLIMGPGAIQAAYTLPLGGGVSPTAVAPTPTPTQPPPPPSSPQPPTPLEGASFLWIAAVGVAAAAAAAVAFALTRRRRPPPAIAREKHVVDVERLDR